MKFYYKTENLIEGPYSAKEMMTRNLPLETMVSEQTIDGGKWKQLCEIDIERLSTEEPEESKPIVVVAVNHNEKYNDEKITFDENEKLPDCFDKWNWGAFGISPIWGLFHGIIWPFGIAIAVGIVVAIANNPVTSSAVSSIAVIIIIISLYLGANGNRLAWHEMQEPRDADHFDRKQKVWNKIGIICLIVGIVGYIVNHFLFS